MKSDFISAINQLSSEKGVSKEVVLNAIERALQSAYKRNYQSGSNVVVRIDPHVGVRVFNQKTVVNDNEVTDARTEITLSEAQQYAKNPEPGQVLEIETTAPREFGRIAAQTAKQVVTQCIREAERDQLFREFIDREGDIVNGLVQRVVQRNVLVDLGKIEAVLPPQEQIESEQYPVGKRLKVYVLEVARGQKGAPGLQVTVSRTHRNLLRRLFELEVPEIYNGTVEIKAIAREPGSRSKIAVVARQEGVDPVGSCVGLRGVRIQNIVNELNGEKIDVIEWNPEPAAFVTKALSPAQVSSVEINEAEKTATVWVPERYLSLAIGKEGQNARLAAKLTGWRVDIKKASGDTNNLTSNSGREHTPRSGREDTPAFAE